MVFLQTAKSNKCELIKLKKSINQECYSNNKCYYDMLCTTPFFCNKLTTTSNRFILKLREAEAVYRRLPIYLACQ